MNININIYLKGQELIEANIQTDKNRKHAEGKYEFFLLFPSSLIVFTA